MRRLSPGYLNSSSFLRLRTALGSTPAGETAPAEVMKYDWRSPRYFNEDQRNRLAAVMSQVAAAMGTAFTHSFNREMTVAPTSITQHFSGRLRELGLSEGRYYLTFAGGKDKGWGFLSFTAQAALRWVKCLLGDSGSDTDASRALSSLEESLLVDLAATALNGFLSPVRAHQDLRPGDHLLKDDPQAQFEPAQELCMIVFAVTGNESQEKDELLFLLPCSLLAPLAGKSRQALSPTPPEELSRVLMEHVQQMPITVTARLGHTALRFEELLELGRDDVLLLDRSLDEMIEVLVDGRVVFRGRVAQSDGRRAVVITQSPAAGGQKIAKPAAN